MAEPLGPRHPEVRRLRALARDKAVRSEVGACVAEGPRVLVAALDRGATVEAVYASDAATAAHAALVDRAAASGALVRSLAPGVADRVADTRTTQGLFAVVAAPRAELAELLDATFLVVVSRVNDPGNAGAIVRSAEAFGADGIVLGAGSVDAYNPKAVRASAGAIFGVPVVEGWQAVEVLERLGEAGVRRLGAAAGAGRPIAAADLTGPVALVLGHEAAGLDPALPVDEAVHVPLAGAAESLNLAMATTVLCAEVARQRAGGA